jgi:hypothetical protein
MTDNLVAAMKPEIRFKCRNLKRKILKLYFRSWNKDRENYAFLPPVELAPPSPPCLMILAGCLYLPQTEPEDQQRKREVSLIVVLVGGGRGGRRVEISTTATKCGLLSFFWFHAK